MDPKSGPPQWSPASGWTNPMDQGSRSAHGAQGLRPITVDSSFRPTSVKQDLRSTPLGTGSRLVPLDQSTKPASPMTQGPAFSKIQQQAPLQMLSDILSSMFELADL